MERFLNFDIFNDDDCEENSPDLCKQFECQLMCKWLMKRSHLNDYINDIYLINYGDEPNVAISAEENKNIICETLDTVLKPPILSTNVAAIQRVKKQLFRKPRLNLRKQTKPQRRITSLTECFYPRDQLHLIGRYKVQRNYLKQVIQSMLDEEYRHEVQVLEHLAANEDIQESTQQLIGDVYRYRYNDSRRYQKVIQTIQELKEFQMEQYNRDRLLANSRVSASSESSATYLKVLTSLVTDYD